MISTRKKLFAALLIYVILSVSALAQPGNPFWTLPPKYIPTNPLSASSTSLPTQSSPGYTGAANVGPHNAYFDQSGNLLFFAIDGIVYSQRGYLVDSLIDTLSRKVGSNYVKSRKLASGWAETCIVPFPGSCSKYYIFSCTDYGWSSKSGDITCYQSGVGTFYEVTYKPCYAIIDVAQLDPNAPVGSNEKGKITTPSGGSTTGRKVVDLYSSTSTTTSEVGNSCSPYPADVNFACTKLLNGTFRWFFVKTLDELIIYKIDANGITFIQNNDISYWYPQTDAYVNDNLSELEVYDDSTNNKIKVACSMSDATYRQTLILMDVNRTTGNLITSPTPRQINFSGGLSPDFITGVEFSPDGGTVYITKERTTQDTSTVLSLNYATPTTRTKFSYKSDFSNSQMEIGKDGVLWFIGQAGANTPRFAKITSPNSPNAGNFSDNQGTLSNYAANCPISEHYPVGTGTSQTPYKFYLPDQIDKEYYGTPQFSDASCCSIYSLYDKDYYTTTNSFTGGYTQTWKPNTAGTQYNPLIAAGDTKSTALIESELRIAPGYTVTIQNMTIKFTPHATLVVEGANFGSSINSGALILKKCTLDVDDRCETKMWPGVRVWGNNTYARNNTNQGYILLDSTCVVTNAWVGIELGYQQSNEYKYNTGVAPRPPVLADTAQAGGGQINCQNSSFINNQRDIYFGDYPTYTGGTCSIFNNTFTTTAYLKPGSSTPPLYHIQFVNYKPNALIQGNTFTCSTSLTASGYVYGHYGIYSSNSVFSVDHYPTGSVRNKISNMLYGIYALNSGGNANTFSVKNTTFTNNKVGTYAGLVPNLTFDSDTVKIYNLSAPANASGLYLDNCYGYDVMNNYFNKGTGSSANNRYGIVVYNSGSYVNAIWKNTFTNLYKGSQAQYRNYITSGTAGTPRNSGGGLVYICNTFVSGLISGADIYVPQTGSNQNVGATYTGTDSAGVNYSQGTGSNYPIVGGNSFSHTGGSAYDFYIDSAGKAFNSNYVYYCAGGSCTGNAVYPAKRKNVLVASCATDINCATSPYSQGFRTTNPIDGYLSQAAAYKQSYDSLKAIVNSLPTNDPERFDMGVNMGNIFCARHLLMDKAIHTLMEAGDDSSMTVARNLMKEKGLELPTRSRLEIALNISDAPWAVSELANLVSEEGQSTYAKVYGVLVNNMGQSPEQIMKNPANVSLMQSIDRDSSDKRAYLIANNFLRTVGLSDYQPYYQESTPPADSIAIRKGNKDDNNRAAGNSLKTAPNPFKGSTVISATIVEKTPDAFIVITDIAGKEINKFQLHQGENEITFSPADVSQQVFFCSLIIDGVKIKTNKMVMIK